MPILHPPTSTYVRRALASLAALGFVFAAGAASAEVRAVAGEEVNFRVGPSTKHAVLFKAVRDYPVKVIKRDNGWLKVADVDGEEAWVAERLTVAKNTVVIKVDRGNVRKRPDVISAIAERVERGHVFDVVGRRGKWLKLASDGEERGWIRNDLVWGDSAIAKPKPKKTSKKKKKSTAKKSSKKKAATKKADAKKTPDKKADVKKSAAKKADAKKPAAKKAAAKKPAAKKAAAKKAAAKKAAAKKPAAKKPAAKKPT